VKRVVALQHAPGESPYLVGEALALAGIDVRVVRIDLGEPVPEAVDGAGLLVMGGPQSVYQSHDFIPREIALLRAAHQHGLPTLGICLGSQLLAAALGAAVRPGVPPKEIGWYDVTLEEGAQHDALLGPAPQRFRAFHWHGDVFDLPAGATALARSQRTAVQAFRHARAWGLLFHLEVTAAAVDSFAAAFPDELTSAGGSPAALREGTRLHGAALERLGRATFARWAALL